MPSTGMSRTFRCTLVALAALPVSPQQLAAYMRSEVAKWGKAVQASDAKVE